MTRPDRDAVSPPSAVSSGTGGEATGIFLFPYSAKAFRPSASLDQARLTDHSRYQAR